MNYKQTLNTLNLSLVVLILLIIQSLSFAQRRGDNLRFQGLDLVNRNGVHATAMGGAFTAASGELDAFYWNPAGLVGISGFNFNANYTSADALWRESQDYRPNRQVVTMSFILDGLYLPNPEFNGWIDSDAFLEDSTYSVNEPALGNDSYSEEAADWQRELDNSGFNNIAAALPFSVSGKNVVISAGFSRRLNVMNYDRNQTHLTPHPAFDGYADLPPRVTGITDTARITWSDFQRQRSGPLKTFSTAVGFGLSENIQLGIRYTRLSGQTREFQTLNRIGHFDLVQGIQIFRFSYDTLNIDMTGASDFSATDLTFGAVVKLGKLSLGASLTSGHTLKREWNYQLTTATADSSSSETITGEDRLDIPLSYSFGLNIQPHEKFRVAFDLEHRPYSKGDVNLASEDATFSSWADQTSFRVGLEFVPVKNFALMGGYRDIPQVFIPDGAADHERGPEAEYYSVGASLNIPFARLDFAYEIGKLKYYDVYFSNTNFAFERSKNLLFGITLMR